MITSPSRWVFLLLMLGLGACLPGRASVPEDRILEPDLGKLAPAPDEDSALEIRIQSVRARTHITTNVLHRTTQGEIQSDPVWTWSVSPALYLGQALDLVASSDPGIRLMDSTRKGFLQIELLAFEIQEGEKGPGTRIAILARFRGPDRAIQVRAFEQRTAIQGEMPRSLSKAMGTSLVSISREILAEAKKLLR